MRYVNLGKKCNNNCHACVNAKDDSGHGSPVVLIGGEPTLYEDLKKSIKEFKKNSKVAILTNARMFSYPEFTEAVVNAGLDKAIVKIWSTKSEVHGELTGTKDSFIQTLEGVKNLTKHPVNVSLFVYVCRQNYSEILDIAMFFTCNFPGIFQINISYPHPDSHDLSVGPRLSDIQPELAKVLEFSKNKNIDIQIEGIPLCFMKGYEEYSYDCRRKVEKDILETEINPFFSTTNEFPKVKTETCSRCSVNDCCPGVWKFYEDKYGLNELTSYDSDRQFMNKINSYFDYLKEVINNNAK